MSKKNQIDKAIEALEADKAVLQLAIDKLRAQQAKTITRKPRVKAVDHPSDYDRELVGKPRF